ncbi:MAG: hypothetical protein Q8N18_12315 [Opitutaceae bacterium]|nr:hypothetical protein [Opitutaceae bacterium]
MKLLSIAPLLAACALAGFAAEPTFPGLDKVLTPAEWKRAGLDRLTPDELGVIDAALIRHVAQVIVKITTPPPVTPEPGTTAQENAVARSRFWDRFGFGKAEGTGWRDLPPMKAKVTGWQGANRFSLDTGQVWEGVEPIPYEILGATVTIEARPLGAFALKLNEDSLAVRVRRVK